MSLAFWGASRLTTLTDAVAAVGMVLESRAAGAVKAALAVDAVVGATAVLDRTLVRVCT